MSPSGSPTVKRVLEADLCSGCGLCASLTGSPMVIARPGYNRPAINQRVSAETDRIIAGTCPGSRVAPWSQTRSLHPYWGPYINIWTGHATDDRLRYGGSSGGVLSGLLCYAIETGVVDSAIEIGADPDTATRNSVIIARNRDDVLSGAGSRYAPSSPLELVSELLEGHGRMAFVGKPCDVSALRLLGEFDPRVKERFPLMMSFFCAGISSLAGSDRILASMGVAANDLKSFRYRGEGWPGFATAVLHDGSEKRMSYEDSWGGHLSKEVQFRCKICPDAVGGTADIVCADAWYGGETGYPQFTELPGRSLVISRTDLGQQVLSDAVTAGAIKLSVEPVRSNDIDLMQPGQARRKRLVRARVAALKVALRPHPRMAGLLVHEASRRASWSESLRNFLGTLRRVMAAKRLVPPE